MSSAIHRSYHPALTPSTLTVLPMVIYGFCTWKSITFIILAIFTACEMGSCVHLSLSFTQYVTQCVSCLTVVLCNTTATCNRARVEINRQSTDESIGRKVAGIAVINHFSHFKAKIKKNAEHSVVTSLFIL